MCIYNKYLSTNPMAFRVKGIEVLSDDGALAKQSISATRDGSSVDLTPTDELAIYDSDGNDDVMRITVNEFLTATGLDGDNTGATGPAGPSNSIDSTNTQSVTGEFYPLFVSASGTETPRVTTGAGNTGNSKFTFEPFTAKLGLRHIACEQSEIAFTGTTDLRLQAGSNIKPSPINTGGGSSTGGRIGFIYGTSQEFEVRFGGGGPFRPELANDNQLDLGNSNGRWREFFCVNGTINTSDAREKTEITDSVLGTDFIKSLRPVSYKWISNGADFAGKEEDGTPIFNPTPGTRTHWGFIAQEVKQSVDDAGVDFAGWTLGDKEDPDSRQGLRYSEMIAPLTKALQEALERIETLETEVADLKNGSV